MRGRFVVVALALGCTTANPAFDHQRPVADGGDDGVDDGDGGVSTGPSSTITDTTTGRGTSDGADTRTDDGPIGTSDGRDDVMSADVPPGDSCPFKLGSGLELAFGDPQYFGNSCPNGVGIWAQLDLTGATPTASSCNEGCETCDNAHPISAEPLPLTGHVPADTSLCLGIEAAAPLGSDGENCYWGALTIWDAASLTPYLVATARGFAPTDTGARLLAGAIAPPEDAGTCGCETLDFVDACCAEAEAPPTFFYFPHDMGGVYTGDSVPVSIDDAAGFEHRFELFQAQAIPSCNGDGPRISWAVYAEL